MRIQLKKNKKNKINVNLSRDLCLKRKKNTIVSCVWNKTVPQKNQVSLLKNSIDPFILMVALLLCSIGYLVNETHTHIREIVDSLYKEQAINAIKEIDSQVFHELQTITDYFVYEKYVANGFEMKGLEMKVKTLYNYINSEFIHKDLLEISAKYPNKKEFTQAIRESLETYWRTL